MAVYSKTNSEHKIFESRTSYCRDIYDNVVIFGRDGKIITSRVSDPRLYSGADLFSLMSQDESRRVAELCISFDYNRLIVNTDSGVAVIYTDACGACGLLIAFFPFAPARAIASHFAAQALPSVYISPEALALSDSSALDKNLLDHIRRADEAFMTVNVSIAKYIYGNEMIKSLGEHLLSLAEFMGCVGTVKGVLDVRPSFDNFSAEVFLTMALCCILFARNHGLSRQFTCKIFEYNSHPIVAFCIDVDEIFKLIRNEEYIYPEIDFCLRSADRRRTFFECYHHKERSSVIIAFAPEIDPIDGRIIKQDIAWRLKDFWEKE